MLLCWRVFRDYIVLEVGKSEVEKWTFPLDYLRNFTSYFQVWNQMFNSHIVLLCWGVFGDYIAVEVGTGEVEKWNVPLDNLRNCSTSFL